MRAARFAVLGVIALALAGCTLLKGPETEAPAETPGEVEDARAAGTEVEQLLDYFQRLRKLRGAELGREHNNARVAFNRTRSEFDRVRLAMVLSLPNTAVSDDPRALELLDSMVRNENSTLRGLALLMSAYLQERRRLDGSVQSLQQSVQGLQQNVQALQQKLDALKSMERSLIEREQAGQKRR